MYVCNSKTHQFKCSIFKGRELREYDTGMRRETNAAVSGQDREDNCEILLAKAKNVLVNIVSNGTI